MPLLYLLLVLVFAAAPLRAQDWTTEDVYTRHQESVVQVRIIDAKGGAKRSIGSGFLISDDGRLITNFHVVADFVHHPENHRAEWQTSDGSKGALELLDVDVVHDLAVMRAVELVGRPFLAVESNLPKMGERIFSLGFPYDLGLTIVEGTYNGLLEKSLYERIHLTASINPGMSGGPALDRAGNVIGVNVASAGEQVGFLVPARHVIGLLTRDPAAARGELMDRIGAQLAANQAQYLIDLMQADFESVQLGAYRVPAALSRYISCWSQTDQDSERRIDRTDLACQSEDDIFLAGDLATGAIRYEHELRQARRIGVLRFWAQMERDFTSFYGNLGGDKSAVTRFECHSDFVDEAGIRRKLLLCARRYREFDGLYDLVQRQVTLDAEGRSLQSTLVLTGVDREHGLRFARRFVESIRPEQP